MTESGGLDRVRALAVLLAVVFVPVAWACPDFSGTFQANLAEGTLSMTEVQNGCAELKVHTSFVPSDGGAAENSDDDVLLDGVIRQIDPENGYDLYRSAELTDSQLILRLIGVKPASDHPVLISARRVFSLDSSGDLEAETTSYDAAGKVTGSSRQVYRRAQ